ncbi:glucagon receptor-like [Heptranchias perlo]|uniref:glucagon receptor-like n=1 Tax=Heptranchias perlo TaxID=212740 RepID=UPI00355A53D1
MPLKGGLIRTLFLILAALNHTQKATGKRLEDTVQDWKHYKQECDLKMAQDPASEEMVCTRNFDSYACWPDGRLNTTVRVRCPWYLPWYETVQHRSVLRQCGPDGHWVMDNLSRPWRDHSACEFNPDYFLSQEETGWILDRFRVMYTVGYSLSLTALVLAFTILLAFRKLRCTRNYIHLNLFASFILRAASILARDGLLRSRYSRGIQDQGDLSVLLSDRAVAVCQAAQALTQYCVAANYYWLLVEGLYLHNLLLVAVFSQRSYYLAYMTIGWGTPILFVIPWVIVKHLYENTHCWVQNQNMAFWWIIRSPILFAILVNFFIFIRIVIILVSKMKAKQMGSTDYKFR